MNFIYFAAALGFAFVWIWIRIDFAASILCLLGALVFALIAALVRGEIDLPVLQERLGLRRR